MHKIGTNRLVFIIVDLFVVNDVNYSKFPGTVYWKIAYKLATEFVYENKLLPYTSLYKIRFILIHK